MSRKNNFRVKKIQDDEITLEEVSSKNPFILFLKLNSGIIYSICMILAFCVFAVGIGLSISSLKESTYENSVVTGLSVSFDDGVATFNQSNMTPITEAYAKRLFLSRCDSIKSTDGAIIELKRTEFEKGIIIFFSDKTALVKYFDGTIKKIDSFGNNYGITEKGIIVSESTIATIYITRGPIDIGENKIVFYSDGSAEIIHSDYSVIIRDSSIISLNNPLILNNSLGISVMNIIKKIGPNIVTYYSDGTLKIIDGNNNIYIVRDLNDVSITDDSIKILNNNAPRKMKEETLNSSKLIYYSDGTIEIIINSNSVMIRRGSYVIKSTEVFEIIPTDIANFVNNSVIDKRDIYYFNNGTGVIKMNDSSYKYIADNYYIKENETDNISGVMSNKIKTLSNGTLIVDFDNSLSMVGIDGTYYIIPTASIRYDDDGSLIKIDNESDEFLSMKKFTIANNYGKKIRYRIVIEETDDYSRYGVERMLPEYIKYQLLLNGEYVSPKILNNVWAKDSELLGGLSISNNTYILYEGELDNMQTLKVDASLWIDYDTVVNAMMKHAFIGTIKVYGETVN